MGVAVGVLVAVAVGVGVKVAVGVGVAVLVGVPALVGVAVGVKVFSGVGVAVPVADGVGVGANGADHTDGIDGRLAAARDQANGEKAVVDLRGEAEVLGAVAPILGVHIERRDHRIAFDLDIEDAASQHS